MENQVTPVPADVFIISDNIISSLGFTTNENMEAIFTGKTGISRCVDTRIYPEPFQAARIDEQKLELLRKKNNLEDYTKFESLIILSITDSLSKTSIDLSGDQNLLILSTTKGDIEYLSGKFPPEKETYLWYTAEKVAGFFRMKNQPLVVSNACVSGVAATETAARLLRAGLYKTIVIAGADLVTAFTVSGFQSFKSISSQPCKPYDAARDGLSIGEGVATIILSNDRTFLGNDQEIRVLGGAVSNDANHISGPSRTGDGLHYAIENAVKYAGIQKQSIDFMNLHGTATIFNDEMESKAVSLSQLSDVPANSLKGYWGHTLGASGITEIIASVESLKRNQLIATLGFSTLGVPEKMNIITGNTKKEIHTFLKTASGFGGVNSAIVISKENPDHQREIRKEKTGFSTTSCCIIEDKKIMIDNAVVFENKDATDFQPFIKSAFQELGIPYMKFHKMDPLSKLGFTAVQYLLQKEKNLDKYDKKRVALLFYNTVSSLDTDIKHQQTITDKDNYFPSPALFVYTLPNIVLGEICIMEKIQGETCFFVSRQLDEHFLQNYLQILFDTTDTDAIITGQLDYLGETYKACVSLIEKQKT